MTSTIAYFCARGGRGQCLPRFFPSRCPHTFYDEYCQLWGNRSMSKLNTTTLWRDDVYCDLLLTSDSITLGTDRGNILWLFSIPWLWNGLPFKNMFWPSAFGGSFSRLSVVCIHVHKWAPVVWAKIYPQEVDTRDFFSFSSLLSPWLQWPL